MVNERLENIMQDEWYRKNAHLLEINCDGDSIIIPSAMTSAVLNKYNGLVGKVIRKNRKYNCINGTHNSATIRFSKENSEKLYVMAQKIYAERHPLKAIINNICKKIFTYN